MSAPQWTLRGDADIAAELAPILDDALVDGSSVGEWVEVGGERAYLKASPLRGKARLRHAVRGALGLELPRLREFDNLTWLRTHGFRAPRPLAAGGALRGTRPVFQFLLTAEVPNAPTLREVCEARTRGDVGEILKTLGRTLARLHEGGFVHRDVFPRNLLVEGSAADTEGIAVVFLDAWRGGPGRGLRGPTYDLACLMLFAPELFSAQEQACLLGAYLAARNLAARPLLESVARQRRALARRFERKRRGGGRPAPPREWSPPENLRDATS